MKKTVISMLFVTGLLVYLSGCKEKAAPAQVAPAVSAVEVIQQDLPWNIEYPAQVAGSLEVQIRAQVGGILKERLYHEGEYVTEGTQLFQIDDSEYKVALERAEGLLAQAQAQERQTRRTYTRMKNLWAEKAISRQDYDNALSAYEAAQADVKVAEAGVNTAQINLGYTKVVAPISGIVGSEEQSAGSLIAPAGESGLLTTMVQINPLYVNFSMPNRQFEKLMTGYKAGTIRLGTDEQQAEMDAETYHRTSVDDVPVYVQAVLPDGNVYPQKGKIIFFDSTENVQTSSIAIKASFANEMHSRALMPGQFIRVRLVGAVYKDAVLIPSSAVLNSTQGLLVYVIDENDTLASRAIEAQLQEDVYIVSSGLAKGDRIVNGGLSKVRTGEKVTVQMQPFKVEVPTQTETAASTPTAHVEQALSTQAAVVETSVSTQSVAQAAEETSADLPVETVQAR